MSDEAPNHRSLRPVYFAALLLPIAANTIEILASYALRSMFISGLIQNQNFELYDLGLYALAFAFYPVIYFLVFYWIAPRFGPQLGRDYFRLLKALFLAGTIGSALGAYLSADLAAFLFNSGFTLNPFDIDSLSALINVVLEIIRGGIEVAFLAFGALIIGHLRSESRPSDAGQAVLNDSPQPHVETALGLSTTNPPPMSFSDL